MLPLTILYDEYIDRSKLTEQKKPVEYVVPPPSRGVGTKNIQCLDESCENQISWANSPQNRQDTKKMASIESN